MGIFSAKKTINVASTVYNLAGDIANRPNFMKSTVFGAVMNPNNLFIGETLSQAYLSGPGMNQRALFKWAVRNDYPGLPTYSIYKSVPIDPEVVRPYITVPAGQEVMIQYATISDGDYEVWAEKYMNENFADEINTDWVAEYNKADHTITIQRAGGGTVNFPAGDYDPQGRFVVVNYYTQIPEDVKPVVNGTLVGPVTSGLPSTSGFTLISTTNTGLVNYEQDQTRTITKVYSNGNPTTVDTDYPHIDTPFNTILTVHERDVYNGGVGGTIETSMTTTFRNVWEYREVYASSSTVVVVNDIGGGHTETVTTEITGDFLRTVYDYRMDTQETGYTQVDGGNKVFIYKIGTGNLVLDALDVPIGSPVTAEFFPIIPIRLNNDSITEPEFEDLYEESKKLYKRATRRQKLQKLVDEVEANEDLDEIDYSYVQWGVSLNTEEEECIKYLYTFWKNLIPLHGLSSTYLSTYVSQAAAYNAAMITLNNWIFAQSDAGNPLFGTPKPPTPSFAKPQTVTLKFKTDHEQLEDWDNRISFIYIDEASFSGLGKVGAKKNDYWITKGTPITWTTTKGIGSSGVIGGGGGGGGGLGGVLSESMTETHTIPLWNVFWQDGTNTYKRIRVYGAVHQNFIYGGKAVRINSTEAFDDEDESGFLIPLHYPSLVDAGLVSSTQMATANTYIVFNSYQIVKKKWYQTFLGMLFIMIVIIAAAAIIAPGAMAGMGGFLGGNAAVGASLGLSGTMATIIGAVANAVVGMIVSQIIMAGSVAIFGEKWGQIVAAIVSFAISFGMSGGFNNLATMFQPQNLLNLASALANGYAGFVQANIAEMQADMFKITEKYQDRMEEIEKLMAELMGNDLSFDPMSLTDTRRGNGSRTGSYLPESLDDFIQRTTLTGSDIVDLTLSMVNDFSDLSLTLPKT